MTTDTSTSLSRQMSIVQRRIKATVQELIQTMDELPSHAELPIGLALELEQDAKRHDLYTYCLCLEVALEETRKWAGKLRSGARAVANGEAGLAEPFTTRLR